MFSFLVPVHVEVEDGRVCRVIVIDETPVRNATLIEGDPGGLARALAVAGLALRHLTSPTRPPVQSPALASGSSRFRGHHMNWNQPCAYDPAQKKSFHVTARARLRRLAAELGLPAGSYDLRSNKGGVAVSGEVTLHGAAIYVQVCQPATGHDSGILVRSCRGRRDFTGGPNHLAPLRLLDDLPALAARVRRIAPGLGDSGPEAGR